MKKFPLYLKLRQFKVLANFMALMMAFEAASLPAQAGQLPFTCLNLMSHYAPKDPAIEKAEKDKEAAQKKKDGDIRKAQTPRARPLVIDEKLFAYYQAHPEEVQAWLEDIRIRKDSGLVTAEEEMAALAVTSQKARDVLAVLLPRQNIYVRYSSRLGTILDSFHLFELQKSQASVKRTSYKPLWLWKLFKGKNYSRAFTITLQRQVPERDDGDTNLFRKPNVNLEEYFDSDTNAFYIAKLGSDPSHVVADLKEKEASIVATGEVLETDAKIEVKYESSTNFTPLVTALRQIILRWYPTAVEIGNTRDSVEKALTNQDIADKLILDLNQKSAFDYFGSQVYMNRLADRTGQREIPKSLFKTLKNVGLAFVVFVFGRNIIIYFLPAGAGKVINGKNIKIDASCNPKPDKPEWIAVMVDQPGVIPLSPFDPAFIDSDARPRHEGQNNPCDPKGEVRNEEKAILKSLNYDDGAVFDQWKKDHQPKMTELRNKIRAAYLYKGDDPPSACAVYYAWYNGCQQESN